MKECQYKTFDFENSKKYWLLLLPPPPQIYQTKIGLTFCLRNLLNLAHQITTKTKVNDMHIQHT